MTTCPVHEDSSPSLNVTWRAASGQRGGLVLLHCHGCGASAEDIAAAFGLATADLFDEPLPPRPIAAARVGRSPAQRKTGARRGRLGPLPAPLTAVASAPELEHEWQAVSAYPYVDVQGSVVQLVRREECVSCAQRHKTFRQAYLVNGRERATKPKEFLPVLYRLPDVVKAVAAGVRVWIVEGEKDADNATTRYGIVATTNAGGGRGFGAELAEVLAGADVAVVLDRDNTGWDRGVALHDLFTAAGAASVHLFLPATLDVKSDLSDHIDAGFTLEELVPVAVDEVRAWAGAAAVERALKSVAQCEDEAAARMTASAERGVSEGDREEQIRFARRWAVESEIRFERIRDGVDDVRRLVAGRATPWAAQALETAHIVLDAAAGAARRGHQLTGLAVPAAMQPPLPTPQSQPTPNGELFPRPMLRIVAGGRRIDAPDYQILDGAIVQITKPVKKTKGDEFDSDAEGTPKLVLGMAVQVEQMEYFEQPPNDDVDGDEADEDSPGELGRESSAGQVRVLRPRQLAGLLIAYADPATGEVMRMRVEADAWATGAWLMSLPGPPAYDSRPSGMSKVRDAVIAVSGAIPSAIRYTSTGWRRVEGEWIFIHGRGAITQHGPQPMTVHMSGVLGRYNLPDPATDAETLRECFLQHSAAMLHGLPSRISAPLLGAVWRSALGRNPWVTVLQGSPGSYKTGVASLMMHHWGEGWGRTKPGTSLSGNGDTANGLRIKAHLAKDVMLWGDDAAPTRDILSAQRILEETTRMFHNAEGRGRSSRDGQTAIQGGAPRSSALLTSEVMPRPGSGAQRMLLVPMRANEIDLATIIRFDHMLSRNARARLMASLLQWLATDLPERRRTMLAAGAQFVARMREQGSPERLSDAVGSAWVGWHLMTTFLLEQGALTAEEVADVLKHAEGGLTEAVERLEHSDVTVTTGERVCELLTHAFSTGIAYVEDHRTGNAPQWPLASQLGWKRTQVGTTQLQEPLFKDEARGIRSGYVNVDPSWRTSGRRELMLTSHALEQILKTTSGQLADGLMVDRATAIRELEQQGILVPESDRHLQAKREIPAEDRRARFVVLDLDKLLAIGSGNDGPADTTPGGGGGPTPGPAGPTTAATATAAEVPEAVAAEAQLFDPTTDGPSGDDSDEVDAEEMSDDGATPTSTSLRDEDSALNSTTWADADGVELVRTLSTGQEPCLLCGQLCTVTFGGDRIHIQCLMTSTAATRGAARTARIRVNAAYPAPPAATAPAGSENTLVVSTAVGTGGRTAAPVPRGKAGALRAALAVVDVDGVWLPDGTRLALPETVAHIGDLAQLATTLQLGTAITQYRTAPGQIWVTGPLLAQLGVDVDTITATQQAADLVQVTRDVTRGIAAVDVALAAGWNVGGEGDCLGPWNRMWSPTCPGVWVVLIPALPGADNPILTGDPVPAVIARRAQRLATELKAPWTMSGQTTGLTLMTDLRFKDRDRLFAAYEPAPPAQSSTTEEDLSWSRPPSAEESQLRYVHAYDRSGSYAAGIASLEVGIGEPEYHGDGAVFDPKLPGYWLVEAGDAADWRLPHPLLPRPRRSNPNAATWVTTPTLTLATEWGYDPAVLQAYTWSQHGRVLEGWYERIRDARAALDTAEVDDQLARELVKIIYTRTIGMLASPRQAGKLGYAPDRRHHIVAKARANILRRVAQIGRDTDRWPVAILTDTVLYASDEADPTIAWPGTDKQLGRAFGQYKPEGSALLADQLHYLDGGGYRGKGKLTSPSSWNAKT